MTYFCPRALECFLLDTSRTALFCYTNFFPGPPGRSQTRSGGATCQHPRFGPTDRGSRRSALWCIGSIEQLWRAPGQGIAAGERKETEKTFKAAIEEYRKIAAEAPERS
jgi:hypothetical protein